MSKEAMKLALDALEDFEDAIRYDNEQDDIGARVCCDVLSYNPHTKDCKAVKAITALREALAEQPAQQEPDWLDKQQTETDWDHVWLLIKAASYASSRGFISGTSNWGSAVSRYMRNESPQQAQHKPLTDEHIQEVVTKAVRERKLSWLGFKKDDQGEYTIPVLSLSDYQMARVIEAAHSIKENI